METIRSCKHISLQRINMTCLKLVKLSAICSCKPSTQDPNYGPPILLTNSRTRALALFLLSEVSSYVIHISAIHLSSRRSELFVAQQFKIQHIFTYHNFPSPLVPFITAHALIHRIAMIYLPPFKTITQYRTQVRTSSKHCFTTPYVLGMGNRHIRILTM